MKKYLTALAVLVFLGLLAISARAEGFPMPPNLLKVTEHGCSATLITQPDGTRRYWATAKATYKESSGLKSWEQRIAIRDITMEGSEKKARRKATEDCLDWMDEFDEEAKQEAKRETKGVHGTSHSSQK